jgi:hypothetical protein
MVKAENLIREILENVEGSEACLLLNSRGEILSQQVLNKSDHSIQLTSLLLETIIKSKVEANFSSIKFVKLEGINNKLILSYLPHQDVYIIVVGTKTMMSGIVQIYLNKLL